MTDRPAVLLFGENSVERATHLERLLTTDWELLSWNPEQDREETLADHAARTTAIVGGKLNRAWPPRPKLRLYQIPFTGYDWIRPEDLPQGTRLCNAYEHETAIAEYSLLGMLEFETGLLKTAAAFKQKSWNGRTAGTGPTHGELRGKTLGILGFGHIGHETAQRARAFGMRTIGVARTARSDTAGLDWLGSGADLDRLLAESDYLLVACPLTEETRDLVNASALGRMKPSAILINVARGPVVNEEALYRALERRDIAGAMIDVWYRYPSKEDASPRPSDFPFHDLDNVIMTPHNSGWTEETIARRWQVVAANLDRFHRGEPLQNTVFEGTGGDS